MRGQAGRTGDRRHDRPIVRRPRSRRGRASVSTLMAGYSGIPLYRKLGIKPGSRVRTANAPADYETLLGAVPDGAVISPRLRSDIDLWHLFTQSRAELARELPRAMRAVAPDGMVWVSWPKKASGVRSDITEDTIRSEALPLGLVDVKVCAVDETWSGLKLVIRKALRR